MTSKVWLTSSQSFSHQVSWILAIIKLKRKRNSIDFNLHAPVEKTDFSNKMRKRCRIFFKPFINKVSIVKIIRSFVWRLICQQKTIWHAKLSEKKTILLYFKEFKEWTIVLTHSLLVAFMPKYKLQKTHILLPVNAFLKTLIGIALTAHFGKALQSFTIRLQTLVPVSMFLAVSFRIFSWCPRDVLTFFVNKSLDFIFNFSFMILYAQCFVWKQLSRVNEIRKQLRWKCWASEPRNSKYITIQFWNPYLLGKLGNV